MRPFTLYSSVNNAHALCTGCSTWNTDETTKKETVTSQDVFSEGWCPVDSGHRIFVVWQILLSFADRYSKIIKNRTDAILSLLIEKLLSWEEREFLVYVPRPSQLSTTISVSQANERQGFSAQWNTISQVDYSLEKAFHLSTNRIVECWLRWHKYWRTKREAVSPGPRVGFDCVV